ncbi:MAG TPA: DUF6261 family protein [Paludibacter sp.]|nr:DUF6261 family protein [Paludibacter sp.]
MKKNFWNLNVGVIANLATRVLDISIKPIYVNLVESLPFLQKLTEANAAYHVVIDKPTYSGKGKQVSAADLLRDNRFLGFKNAILGLIQLDGIAFHQDAVDLKAIIDLHGADLYRYTYDDESTHLNQLIQDLEKPENITRLQHLNLTEAFALLKASQTDFIQLVGGQSEADSILRGMESASSLYKNMATSLRNYVNYVDAMTDIDSTWTALSLELNEALKAANNKPTLAKTDTTTETK